MHVFIHTNCHSGSTGKLWYCFALWTWPLEIQWRREVGVWWSLELADWSFSVVDKTADDHRRQQPDASAVGVTGQRGQVRRRDVPCRSKCIHCKKKTLHGELLFDWLAQSRDMLYHSRHYLHNHTLFTHHRSVKGILVTQVERRPDQEENSLAETWG